MYEVRLIFRKFSNDSFEMEVYADPYPAKYWFLVTFYDLTSIDIMSRRRKPKNCMLLNLKSYHKI